MSTPDQSTAERAGAETGPREYRVTFGQRYPREVHATFPAAHKDGWLAVKARDYREAFDALARVLDDEWCNFYPPHLNSYPQVRWYPLGEIGFLDATVAPTEYRIIQRNEPVASTAAQEVGW